MKDQQKHISLGPNKLHQSTQKFLCADLQNVNGREGDELLRATAPCEAASETLGKVGSLKHLAKVRAISDFHTQEALLT